MTAARPLTGAEIIELVGEVPVRLEPGGTQHVVVIVGGSLLAWRGLRASTEDVDSVTRFDGELRRAVEQVAAAHDLPPRWLNDNAAMFLPATFERGDCDVLMDHPRLVVLGAPLKVVFVMKMYRADPNDLADMVVIWPLTGFRSAQEVVDAFFAAYPHAPDDPHLDQFVVEVASRAGHSLPLH
jgi:hypothetical protein